MYAVRRHLGPTFWRIAHVFLAAVIVVGSVVHAVLIEGVMGEMSKWVLCGFILAATLAVIVRAVLGSRQARALRARRHALEGEAPGRRG